MDARERINKAAFDMMSGMKEATSTAVVKAVSDGTLKMEPEQIKMLVRIVEGTIEATYHQGNRVFMRSVDASLARSQPIEKK